MLLVIILPQVAPALEPIAVGGRDEGVDVLEQLRLDPIIPTSD